MGACLVKSALKKLFLLVRNLCLRSGMALGLMPCCSADRNSGCALSYCSWVAPPASHPSKRSSGLLLAVGLVRERKTQTSSIYKSIFCIFDYSSSDLWSVVGPKEVGHIQERTEEWLCAISAWRALLLVTVGPIKMWGKALKVCDFSIFCFSSVLTIVSVFPDELLCRTYL